MKNRNRIILAIGLLALAGLACALPTSINDIISIFDKTENSDGILFSDDFSNEFSGWDRNSDEDVITDYDNGYYRINVNVIEWDYWSNPGKNFTDVRIEVDATKAAGPDENDVGVICRYKNSDQFYFFLVSSDGYYGIGKVTADTMDLIGQEELLPSDAINLGLDTNHIRADCIGSELSLYVNGIFLTSTTDSEYTFGDVGLLAGTYDVPGVDILFDNFVVYDPALKK